MTLKHLIVFVDDQPGCLERIRVAATLAQRHDAHLTGIHVNASPVAPPVLNGVGVEAIVATQEERIAEAETSAETGFREAMQRDGIRHDWRAVRGPIAVTAALQAHCVDLIVASQPEPGRDDVVRPEDIALMSGRPALAVPYVGRFATVAERPMIAWRPTRESARAVADALPLLRLARRVTILVVNPDEHTGTDGDGAANALSAHLAHHGVAATVERSVTHELSVADAILSRAADLASDLLVMGCYSHARLRELVLGGVTRDILRHMTLPVLMSH
jgi:nucleotide-binding universal stress UspA family protein